VQKRGLFLISAGAAAIASGFAARRQLYAVARGCGLPPFPPKKAGNVNVVTDSFHSTVLGVSIGRVTIDARPTGATRSQPALIFALPGRDGTAEGHADGLRLADFLGNTVAESARRPVKMIIVDSGASYWHPRRSGEDRMQMLIEEIVKPAMHANQASRERAGIIGWSMGAYGALLAAEMHPDLFGTVCATSIAMWRSAAEQQSAVPDAFDNADDFRKFDLRGRINALRNANVRMSCGQSDPFYTNDHAFARDLSAAGIRADIDFPPGCHDDGYWMRVAPADFNFLVKNVAS